MMNDQEFWEQCMLAILSRTADNSEPSEDIAREAADLASCCVEERRRRMVMDRG